MLPASVPQTLGTANVAYRNDPSVKSSRSCGSARVPRTVSVVSSVPAASFALPEAEVMSFPMSGLCARNVMRSGSLP